MSRNSVLVRVRQVASPRKTAKTRIERVQKINKVSKSLFGPVIKSEFQRFAQLEMTKYQLQASNKWSFDFIKESPITHANSQFKWESTTFCEMPKFYHHISHPMRLMHQPTSDAVDVNNRRQLLFSECENICPLSQSISAPSMIIQNPLAVNKRKMVTSISAASSSLAASTVCNGSQRKITDYLKVRKRRMSTTSAVCLKKARADF